MAWCTFFTDFDVTPKNKRLLSETFFPKPSLLFFGTVPLESDAKK